jgi:hypothetical protein
VAEITSHPSARRRSQRYGFQFSVISAEYDNCCHQAISLIDISGDPQPKGVPILKSGKNSVRFRDEGPVKLFKGNRVRPADVDLPSSGLHRGSIRRLGS